MVGNRKRTDPSGSQYRSAWLSSARVVRCSIKSANERNPRRVLYVSRGTAGIKPEEGEDDVKSAWPLYPGLHTRYNGQHNRLRNREVEPIPKVGLSSDCRLQPACMKPELLVTAGQHTAVNTFPGLVHTARHVMGAGNT